MKRFLVSLDGSELSEKVLPRWCRVHPTHFTHQGKGGGKWNTGMME
ncbi:MAG: hypothetical protein V3R78_08805 [Thermodesulfobacteriota bacterium]